MKKTVKIALVPVGITHGESLKCKYKQVLKKIKKLKKLMKENIVKIFEYNNHIVIVFNDEFTKRSNKEIIILLEEAKEKANIFKNNTIIEYKIKHNLMLNSMKKSDFIAKINCIYHGDKVIFEIK
jgi:hypothetical protein